MKNNIFKLLIGFTILLLIYLVFFDKTPDFILTDDIKKSNIVNSYVNDSNVEDIIYIGMDLLDIDSTTVNLFNLPEFLKYNKINNEIFIINALIYKNFDNTYTIYINDSSPKNELNLYLSHELIHLNQYYNNRLNILFGGIIKFDSLHYIVKNVNYLERPWEMEAFEKQDSLLYEIESVYYR